MISNLGHQVIIYLPKKDCFMDGYEVVKLEGRTEYYYNGLLHRDNDLPAIEWENGSKEWYQHGKSHRLNGPAWEYSDCGIKYKEWYIEGKNYTE
jgi:hypothetical protein